MKTDKPTSREQAQQFDILKLLPAQEWDFRELPEEECGIATFVEYLRNADVIHTNPREWVLGRGKGTMAAKYLMLGVNLSQSWQVYREKLYKELSVEDIKNLPFLIEKLKDQQNALSQFLTKKFTRPELRLVLGISMKPDIQRSRVVIQAFNRILRGPSIWNEKLFAQEILKSETRVLASAQEPSKQSVLLLNRMLLEDAFAGGLRTERDLTMQHWEAQCPTAWSSVGCYSIKLVKNNFKRRIANREDPIAAMEAGLSDSGYYVLVNSLAPRKRIQEDFGRALEDKGVFGNALKGRASSTPFHRLKWLAAYRLEMAMAKMKLPFADFQASLNAYARTHPVRDGSDTLPQFKDRRVWTGAVLKARKLLSQFEMDPQRFEADVFFGLVP